MMGGLSNAFWILEPIIVQGERSYDYYVDAPEGGAPAIVGDLFSQFGWDRASCPYILLTVVQNTHDSRPTPGGRTLNGGFSGGGIIITSSSWVTNSIFLSTLIHEIGHGFGLPHVDAYGYDLYSGPSIMSYNTNHHSFYEDLGSDPGVLIAEDKRGLSMNKDACRSTASLPARLSARAA